LLAHQAWALSYGVDPISYQTEPLLSYWRSLTDNYLVGTFPHW